MDTKSRSNEIMGFILLISIFLNVYQFEIARSTKKFEHAAALNNFKLIVSNYLVMANNLDNFIAKTTNLGTKEAQDTNEIFSAWNTVYSVSKEIEYKLKASNKTHFKTTDEILYTQDIMSIINKNLYTLNTEFLKRSSWPFKISEQEQETLEAIATIYHLLGDGLVTEPDLSFGPVYLKKYLHH